MIQSIHHVKAHKPPHFMQLYRMTPMVHWIHHGIIALIILAFVALMWQVKIIIGIESADRDASHQSRHACWILVAVAMLFCLEVTLPALSKFRYSDLLGLALMWLAFVVLFIWNANQPGIELGARS